MNDTDDRLHALNTAWGRGYVWQIVGPEKNPPWPPGATGDQWARGWYHAAFEVTVHGAVDTRESPQ